MTRDYFIKRAKELYGDAYSYDKVGDITNNKDTVTITCKKHGDFKRIICNFLNGRGCTLCNNDKRTESNKQKIIEKCNKIHNEKYDYSKIKYIKQKKEVCIICPIHGEFWQTLDAHSRGEGCPKCAKEERVKKLTKTTKKFIEDAIKIHGDRYDYSKSDLKNRDEKGRVCIICPIHGEFWQKPDNHLQGNNCPKCRGLYRTTDEFITLMKEKFGNIYDFSKAIYKGSHENITLIYNGKKITTKAIKFLTAKKPITFERVRCKEDFIEKANKIHCGKYDYSKVNYINNTTRVCIICPIHGEFWQTPADHLQGCGCKECKISKLEENMMLSLKKENIDFIHIYRPEWLSSGLSHQSIDIYIPRYNIGIECQGPQHFRNVPIFKDSVEKNIERDIKKFNKSISKLKIFYLIDKHIKKKDIITNKKYGGIYNNTNTFKTIKLLIEHIIQCSPVDSSEFKT